MGATQDLWQQRHVDAYLRTSDDTPPTAIARAGLVLLGVLSLISAAAVMWQSDMNFTEWTFLLAVGLTIIGGWVIAVAVAPNRWRHHTNETFDSSQ